MGIHALLTGRLITLSVKSRTLNNEGCATCYDRIEQESKSAGLTAKP